MKLQSTTFFSATWRRWITRLFCMIITFGLVIPLAGQVLAEGSRDLYPGSAVPGTEFRANINWRTGIFGGLLIRRTLLKVYANANEVILVASSAVDDTPPPGGGGTRRGDILIYPPGQVTGAVGAETIGTPDFSCVNQRNTLANTNLGSIDSRVEELAGPDTITDPATGAEGNPADNTYAPCFYTAPQDGIYHVVFYGPQGDGSDKFVPLNNTGEIDLVDPINFDGNQITSVTAWDVTVRDSLASPTDIPGRLFTDYLSMVTGDNPRPVFSTLFVLTRDGYIYETELGGIDPNAFVFFANNVGFLDKGIPPFEIPLYRDVVGTDNDLAGLAPGIELAPPNQLIFFNLPDPETVTELNIADPVLPQITSITFGGNLGGNNTLLNAGGTFTYTSNLDGIFELIISQDRTNFDPTLPTNRVLRGFGTAPSFNIPWNGADNAGNQFPVGLDYPVRIILRAGEYHFPLLDAENSAGGPRYVLRNSPTGICPNFNGGPASCSIAFYDDRGYRTLGGTDVGTPGSILPGSGPPNPDRSDPLAGFDTSSSNQRAYGDNTTAGFGDKKGLDIWTYFPSEVARTTLNIFATAFTPTPTPTDPPTPTPTPTPTQPSSCNDCGGNGKKDTPTPQPPPTSTPQTVAVVPVPPPGPTAVVPPVTFLPETGLRGGSIETMTAIGGALLLILGSLTAFRRFRRKK